MLKSPFVFFDSLLNKSQSKELDYLDIVQLIREGSHEVKLYVENLSNGEVQIYGEKQSSREELECTLSSLKEAILSLKPVQYKEAKEKVSVIKRNLPAFVSAVKCATRRTEDIESFTGLMTLDIDFEFGESTYDELQNLKKKLFDSEEHILFTFLSPVKGIKLVINIGDDCKTIGQYTQMFNSVVRYYKQKHGIKIDESGKDAVRACFLSYDPEILFRYETTPFENYLISEDEDFEPNIPSYDIEQRGGIIKSSSMQLSRHGIDPIENLANKIYALKELDEKGEIDSKHSELLTIQLKAISLIKSNGYDEKYVYDSLYRAWKSLYENDAVKRDSFRKAWETGLGIVKPISPQKKYFEGIPFSIDRYKKAVEKRPFELLLSLKINGKMREVLTRENYISLVALPGYGKSSIVESICSKVIKPDCIGIHFKVDSNVKKILLIDTENRDADIARMLDKISIRTNMSVESIIDSGLLTIVSTNQYKIDYNIVDFEIMDFLKHVFSTNHYDLVIIDDVSSIVSHASEGVNSLQDSEKASNEFNSFATKHSCGFFLTIHANSHNALGKSRGHLGSCLERNGMGVLHLYAQDDYFSIVGTSLSAKIRRGGLSDLKKNPLHFLYDEALGFMRELKEDEADGIITINGRAKRNKAIQEDIKNFILNKLASHEEPMKQDVIDIILIKYPDISENIIDKQIEFVLKKCDSIEKIKTGKNVKYRKKI